MQARLKKKSINFLEASKRKEKKNDGNGTKRMVLIGIPTLLLVVNICVWMFYIIVTMGIQVKTDEVNAKLQAVTNSDKQAQIKGYQTQINKYDEFLSNYNALLETLDQGAQPSKDLIDQTMKAAGNQIKITDMSYDANGIALTCSATSNTAPAAYVGKLRKLEIYKNLTYLGFSQEGDTFTFTVNGTFSGEE